MPEKKIVYYSIPSHVQVDLMLESVLPIFPLILNSLSGKVQLLLLTFSSQEKEKRDTTETTDTTPVMMLSFCARLLLLIVSELELDSLEETASVTVTSLFLSVCSSSSSSHCSSFFETAFCSFRFVFVSVNFSRYISFHFFSF